MKTGVFEGYINIASAFLFVLVVTLFLYFTDSFTVFLDKSATVMSKKVNVSAYYDDTMRYENTLDGGTIIGDIMSLDSDTIIKINGLTLNNQKGNNENYSVLEEARQGDAEKLLTYLSISNKYVKQMNVDSGGNVTSVNYQLK